MSAPEAACAKLAQRWGYDEVNLNCGCPSERVQRGAFGACLMAEPVLVADCVKAMVDMIKDFKDPQIFQGWIEWRSALSDGLNPAFANKQSVAAAVKEAVRLGDLVLAKYAS